MHSNLWGPTRTQSLNDVRYFMIFIDDFSRKVWVFILKLKDETFEKFKQWKVMVDNHSRNLRCLRTNNGLEFCGEKFSNFYGNQGIVWHRTVKSMPQQNGLVERINRTILERAKCMLINARLLAKFWTEVVNTTCHLINKCLSSAINFKTPQEVWTSKPGSYQHLRVFRSTTYALLQMMESYNQEQRNVYFLDILLE